VIDKLYVSKDQIHWAVPIDDGLGFGQDVSCPACCKTDSASKRTWASSSNYDFAVSFKREELAAGRAKFNYGTIPIKSSEDMMGASVFAKTETGEIFHTYSAYSRGIENLMGAFMWLDLTPKGRHQFDDGHSRLSDDGRDVRTIG